MDSKDYSQRMSDYDILLEITFGASEPAAPTPPRLVEDEYEWYRPGFFTRLSVSRPMLIMLVIAFFLLVVGPSLFYVLNPPRARAPLPVRGIPAEYVLPAADADAAFPS